jgi:urease accessory protein
LTTSHAPGTAHLTFTRSGSATVVTRAFATSPAKLITTRRRAATCWVYSANFGGGIVGGDEIHVTAEVGEGARALLTTQASTRVYRSLRPAKQSVTATVHPHGLLAVVPDPVVCFADAHFTQTQTCDLRRDASLVIVDWLTSGRHAAGERWAFSHYESRFDIRRDAQPIFFDALVLEPFLDSIALRMGHFDVIVTAIVTGPLVADAASSILRRTSQSAVGRLARVVMTAAPLRDGGVLIRMTGISVEDVGRALRDQLAFLSSLAGDDLWSRKW